MTYRHQARKRTWTGLSRAVGLACGLVSGAGLLGTAEAASRGVSEGLNSANEEVEGLYVPFTQGAQTI